MAEGAPEIRAAAPGDEPQLRELRLRALRADPGAFAVTADLEAALGPEHWQSVTAASREADDTVVWMARAGQRAVGMAAGRWYDRPAGVAQLWGMWVDPRGRGFGLGRRLVTAVETWARDRGARVLRLGIIEGVPAEAFYARLGFVRSGETKPLARDASLTAIFMTRNLDLGAFSRRSSTSPAAGRPVPDGWPEATRGDGHRSGGR